MNDNIHYKVILDFLVGDLKSEDELVTILNFLDHAKSVMRYLYLDKEFKKDIDEDRKYLGFLGLDPVE